MGQSVKTTPADDLIEAITRQLLSDIGADAHARLVEDELRMDARELVEEFKISHHRAPYSFEDWFRWYNGDAADDGDRRYLQ
jgi:hypothetical protein